jgi:hypothetical protein
MDADMFDISDTESPFILPDDDTGMCTHEVKGEAKKISLPSAIVLPPPVGECCTCTLACMTKLDQPAFHTNVVDLKKRIHGDKSAEHYLFVFLRDMRNANKV